MARQCCLLVLFLLEVLLWYYSVPAWASKMPTFFSADEARYDRYAACLAATEKLRRDLHSDTTSSSSTATAEYTKQASHILNGLGSSLEEYNAIGREVLENKDLRQRVMSQAYLYRVESSISSEKLPLKIDDSAMGSVTDEKIQKFCQSMLDIERLRKTQLGQLNALSSGIVSVLPEGSLTAVAPLLQPQARSLVEDFPKQATAIASHYGLTAEEFNTMLHATRMSKPFRAKVQRSFIPK